MYSNSNEYRIFLRHLAKMDSSKYPVFEPCDDEETMDEFLYDSDAMIHYLDSIYAITKLSPLFMNLYRLAAEKMLSNDPEIGLAIMYSYDYLDLFYPFLYGYLREQNPELYADYKIQQEPIDESNIHYRRLLEFMSPKQQSTRQPLHQEPFPTNVRKV